MIDMIVYIYLMESEIEKATKYLLDCLEGRKEVLGENHQETLTCSSHLFAYPNYLFRP